jgi:hypothetical protein
MVDQWKQTAEEARCSLILRTGAESQTSALAEQLRLSFGKLGIREHTGVTQLGQLL